MELSPPQAPPAWWVGSYVWHPGVSCSSQNDHVKDSCSESIKRSLPSTPVTMTPVQTTPSFVIRNISLWGQESGWGPLRLGSSSSACTPGAPSSGLTIPQRRPWGERRRSPSLRKPTSFLPFAKSWIIVLALALPLRLLFYLLKACLSPQLTTWCPLYNEIFQGKLSPGDLAPKPSCGKGTQRLVHLPWTRSG